MWQMMGWGWHPYATTVIRYPFFPFFPFFPLVLLLIAWELYWKGKALWRAAKDKDRGWFIALLILNTLGILPLIYLYYISKKK